MAHTACYLTKSKTESSRKIKSGGSRTLVEGNSTYRMSSSFANMMMALALEVSSRRLMILSNSPGLGSLGIFKDWAIHTPPGTEIEKEKEG